MSFLVRSRPYWVTVLLGLVGLEILISLCGGILFVFALIDLIYNLNFKDQLCIPTFWGQLIFLTFLPFLT